MVGINTENWSTDNSMRILIASDIHLGHQENDAIRGEDSFIAFEEVLSLAVQYDVDFVLLGGDLFDHAKPSPSCMYKCTQLIRKYCLGDKPVTIEILSDQLENFSRSVNYEDPNLNVSYPILSIHGNHDDPVGQGAVSSLDILSISGLVNYFGKWNDYTGVRISPVLLQKGDTKLALYGLSHLKDQRLARLYAEKKVEMEVPDDGNDWFNMFVLHQNRADRGPNNYIPEKVLPPFLDVVIWGHEHDSLVFPIQGEKKPGDDFYVIQPGSTVATSLAAGEALPKHCALLQVHKKEFMVTPIPLKTVRPFIFKTVVLSEENICGEDVNENKKVQAFLTEKIEEAIKEAEQKRSGDSKQPTLPLVRLSVFYERESQNFNKMRFGQNFNGIVANPTDILIMKKEKKIREKKERSTTEEVQLEGVAAAAADVESLLLSYFAAQPSERQLSVLSVRAMTDAVRDFTLKKDDEIFRRVFDAHKRRAVEFLLAASADSEQDVAERLKEAKLELDSADDVQLRAILDEQARKPPPPQSPVVAVSKLVMADRNSKHGVVVLSSDEDEPKTTTRGRGRGRGARGGRGKARAAPEPPPTPERRTPRRAAQKTASWLQNMSSSRRGMDTDSD